MSWPVLVVRMIVRPIQSHDIPKTRRMILLLLGGEGRDEGECSNHSGHDTAQAPSSGGRNLCRHPLALNPSALWEKNYLTTGRFIPTVR